MNSSHLIAPLLTSVLLFGAACGGGQAGPEIPLPPNLDQLEPILAEKIRVERQAVADGLDDAKAWMGLGMTFEANTMHGYALECYAVAMSIQPSAKGWSRIAQANEKLGKLPEATEAMRRSIELRDDYAPSHWRLGDYTYDLGNFEEAGACYKLATEHDPKHSGGWIGLARVALQARDADRAVQILERLLSRNASDADAMRLLRTAYLQAGKPEKASEINASWRRKSSPGKDPWHREFRAYRERPLMERALADLNGDNPAAAVEVLEEFTAENPEDLNTQSYLAWGYFLTDREAEALRTIEAALEKESTNIPVLRVLARIHERSGRAEEALTIVERILAADGFDTQALKKAGRLSKDLDSLERAVEAFAELLELDRGDLDAWQWKGECELRLERWADAAETFRGALRNKATTDDVRLGLCEALAHLSMWDEASKALERVTSRSARGEALREAILKREI